MNSHIDPPPDVLVRHNFGYKLKVIVESNWARGRSCTEPEDFLVVGNVFGEQIFIDRTGGAVGVQDWSVDSSGRCITELHIRFVAPRRVDFDQWVASEQGRRSLSCLRQRFIHPMVSHIEKVLAECYSSLTKDSPYSTLRNESFMKSALRNEAIKAAEAFLRRNTRLGDGCSNSEDWDLSSGMKWKSDEELRLTFEGECVFGDEVAEAPVEPPKLVLLPNQGIW